MTLLPDLYVDVGNSGSPSQVKAGEPFSIWYTACNKGVAINDQFQNKLSEISAGAIRPVDWHTISELGIGQCVTRSYDYDHGKQEGSYSWRVELDVQNAIKEPNENNNAWVYGLSVLKPK